MKRTLESYALILLPPLVFHTTLVDLDALDGLDPLFLGQEPRICRRVWEEQVEQNGDDEGNETSDDHEPLPWLDVGRLFGRK